MPEDAGSNPSKGRKMYLLHHSTKIHCIFTVWIVLYKGNLITCSNLQAKQMEEAILLANRKNCSDATYASHIPICDKERISWLFEKQ